MMAALADIEEVQDQIPDTAGEEGWDEAKIAEELDSGKSVNAVVLSYWEQKTANTSELIDVSESGSSRALSTIHKNARDMAKIYQDRVQVETIGPVRQGWRSIVLRRT